jgi:hypothetical protein
MISEIQALDLETIFERVVARDEMLGEWGSGAKHLEDLHDFWIADIRFQLGFSSRNWSRQTTGHQSVKVKLDLSQYDFGDIMI